MCLTHPMSSCTPALPCSQKPSFSYATLPLVLVGKYMGLMYAWVN